MNPQVEACRAAVGARPDDPAAHYALAQALDRAGDAIAAIASLRHALRLAPHFPEAHNLIGLLLAGRSEVGAAIEHFNRAIAARPGYARAHNNLGNSLRTIGRIADAERAIGEAVRLQPDYQLAQHNLGAVRQALGKSEAALEALNASLALNPQFRPSWIALAAALRQIGRLDDAIDAYRRAIALDPAHSADERIALAETLAESGFHGDAQQAYADALQRNPDHLAAALGFHLGLPQVYADANAIDIARARFTAGLNALERDFARLHKGLGADATLEAWRWSNFFLAYQGRDDRELQRRYARLLARAIETSFPTWREPLVAGHATGAPNARIRIGFASAFFVDGTVGHYFQRWITELDSSLFEVFVYHMAPHVDALTQRIVARADRFHHAQGAEGTIASIARKIRGDALDVLVYPEVGMDARCVVLAALRLASVQYAGWGHPVTTGHDTIDRFLTTAPMEPADGDAHYVERLVRLPGIGTSYPHPSVSFENLEAMRATLRTRLGVAPDAPVFLCPQALFKILPGDDALFARVLDAAPGSVLLLFAGAHREVTNRTLRRVGAAMTARGIDARERMRVLARMPRTDFLQVNAACDAMLDTHAWSGGNTTLDAIAAGLPVVALPGSLMRARQSAAMLGIAGVPELVAATADDYVQIAQRLVEDPAWATAIRARIAAGSARLFDDRAPLDAFAALIRDAHSRAPGSARTPLVE